MHKSFLGTHTNRAPNRHRDLLLILCVYIAFNHQPLISMADDSTTGSSPSSGSFPDRLEELRLAAEAALSLVNNLSDRCAALIQDINSYQKRQLGSSPSGDHHSCKRLRRDRPLSCDETIFFLNDAIRALPGSVFNEVLLLIRKGDIEEAKNLLSPDFGNLLLPLAVTASRYHQGFKSL